METVCLLSKLSEAKNHIRLKVDMGEMDVTAAENKGIYLEIQEWVQEKKGQAATVSGGKSGGDWKCIEIFSDDWIKIAMNSHL